MLVDDMLVGDMVLNGMIVYDLILGTSMVVGDMLVRVHHSSVYSPPECWYWY